ncbi:sulfite exporter TauE/SafE family protein [Aliagarivorans marinus]|uniref:sulfite exporter TauE/SafE family protein n=1 Tax=Aliagarivorans marinus TaxID=561965 RepID=UPI000406743C|nr:sulfite exporter TauE/SafE family protein [Aliagarivorans marinus]
MTTALLTLPSHLLRLRRVQLSLLLITACLLALTAHGWLTLADPHQLTPLLLVFFAAFCCEYIDSSLGMGYGTSLTPLLLLAGFEPLQVVPCILLSELLTGIAATLMHHRDGNVDILGDRQARGVAFLLGLLSVLGAVVAVSFAVSISKQHLTLFIAGVILLTGVITLLNANKRLRFRLGHILAIGTLAAFNKGVSGGGYGPLVTSGQVVSGISARKAVAITSFSEALTCLVGLLAYMLLLEQIDWSLALPLSAGALCSVPLATFSVRALKEQLLRRLVGICSLTLACLMIIKLFV